jgi:hypothetical protein
MSKLCRSLGKRMHSMKMNTGREKNDLNRLQLSHPPRVVSNDKRKKKWKNFFNQATAAVEN